MGGVLSVGLWVGVNGFIFIAATLASAGGSACTMQGPALFMGSSVPRTSLMISVYALGATIDMRSHQIKTL
jgi:hypothetical protein